MHCADFRIRSVISICVVIIVLTPGVSTKVKPDFKRSELPPILTVNELSQELPPPETLELAESKHFIHAPQVALAPVLLNIPVLLNDVLNALGDINGRKIIDATFGAGGYTRAFL